YDVCPPGCCVPSGVMCALRRVVCPPVGFTVAAGVPTLRPAPCGLLRRGHYSAPKHP
ncbi:hypothetical protein NDU88_006059, partial [Pleurodeles waltl]